MGLYCICSVSLDLLHMLCFINRFLISARSWCSSVFIGYTQFLLSPLGIDIVRKALRIPCYTIAANAGVDAHEIVTRVMQEKHDIGYDALNGKFVDMMKSGIMDPTKVCFV